jgi:predicted RNA binding protein YcfA (HicA-like mRNA interferase family)
LHEAGCEFVREAKGSHEIWYSPLTDQHFTVPKTVKATGTLRAIYKQAGIPNEE